MKKITQKIITWLQSQVKEANANGVVFGLSGGIDSSVVGVLCQKAFPKNCLGLLLPCNSNSRDKEDALLVAKKFSLPTKEVDLSSLFKRLLETLDEKNNSKNLAIANLKPRLRMLTLYYFANKLNYLVVGSGNKSELLVGYFTKYGDGGADVLPLGDLYKTQVRELARYLGVPKKIMEKAPSAGLWQGQTDEQEIGMSYEKLDKILKKIEKKKTKKIDKKQLQKVQFLIKSSEHKRRLPKICKLRCHNES